MDRRKKCTPQLELLECRTMLTFRAGVNINTGPGVGGKPYSVAVGDLRGDGKTDLVVALPLADKVGVLLGNGDGTFAEMMTFSAGPGVNPVHVLLGDFNGGGKLDIATANDDIDWSVSVLLGNGDGSFGPPTLYDGGGNADWIAADDFRGDGKIDLVVSQNEDARNTVNVLLGNGDGTFGPRTAYGVGHYPEAIAVGDFRNEGKKDVAVVNSSSDSVSVLLGNGDGTFQDQTVYPVGQLPEDIVARDFNGDGNLDLAVTNHTDQTVSILLGDGHGTFKSQQTFATLGHPFAIASADFDQDGIDDLAVTNDYPIDTLQAFLGNGDGQFHELPNPIILRTGINPIGIAVGDFNGDGYPDLVVANANSNFVTVFMNNGDGPRRREIASMIAIWLTMQKDKTAASVADAVLAYGDLWFRYR